MRKEPIADAACLLNLEFFEPTQTHTICSWKGEASYYTLRAGKEVNKDVAWTYRQPLEVAEEFRDYVAFWLGVEVVV